MIYQIFFKQVLRNPDVTALVLSNGLIRYSYAHANVRVNQWAYFFLRQGIKAGDRVGVLLNNEDHHIFIYLALDRINAIYVPFDTDIPKQQFVLDMNVLNLKKLLIESCLRETYDIETSLSLTLSEDIFSELDESARSQLAQVVYDNNAFQKISYYVSSSGTTQNKKWIPILGAGLLYWADVLERQLALGSSSRMLATRSPAYDARIFEYVLGFSAGGSLYLLDNAGRKNLTRILDVVHQSRIHCLILIASQLGLDQGERVVTTLKENGLKHLMVTGDACTPELKLLCELKELNLWNAYGPTEATFGLSLFRVNHQAMLNVDGRMIVPIGPAYSEQIRHHLIKDKLYIESPYLTPGYLDPAANEGAFIELKKYQRLSIRLFNTGDIFKEENGLLYFQGRSLLDRCCKVNGVKVSADLIEECIHEYIRKEHSIAQLAVVIKFSRSQNRPFAYLVTAKNFQLTHFLEHIKRRLKTEEIPTFIRLDALPHLQPSDKIDLSQLIRRVDQEHEFLLKQVRSEPSNASHTYVAVKNIWKKTLRTEDIADNIDFVLLGGDSIDLQQMHHYIKKDICPEYDFKILERLSSITINNVVKSLSFERDATHDNALIHPLVATPSLKGIIFCLPSLLGEGRFSYVELSQRVAHLHGKNVYGLSDLGTVDDTCMPRSLSEAAIRYISAIKSVQSSGPYVLLGFSFGSTLAYEVAKRLLETGDAVSDIHLVDGFPPCVYQQLSNADYAQVLGVLLRTLMSILNNSFYSESISLDDYLFKPCVNKQEQIDNGFHYLDEKAKNPKSTTMLKMAKQHLSLILLAPFPEKKLPFRASFYQTKGQAYRKTIELVTGLTVQTSDAAYYFWNRYFSRIRKSSVSMDCEHLDVLTKEGASFLKKIKLFANYQFTPCYQIQFLTATTRCLSLFFIPYHIKSRYIRTLGNLGFKPSVFTYDQNFTYYSQMDMVYTAQVTLVCEFPFDKMDQVEALMRNLSLCELAKDTKRADFVSHSGLAARQVSEYKPSRVSSSHKGNVSLSIFLDNNPLLNLTFNCYCLFSRILATLSGRDLCIISGSNMLIRHAYQSTGSSVFQTLENLSSVLADFISVMNEFMDQAPLDVSCSDNDSSTSFAC